MTARYAIGRSLFFAGVLLLSLIALLPLRMALDWLSLGGRGLAAQEAVGSVWFGALSEARLGRASLGDLEVRLRWLPLLVGRARVDLEGPNALAVGVSVSRRGFGLEDASGRLEAAALFSPLPIMSLDLRGVTARFLNGQCAHAEGKVTASMTGDLAGLSLANGFSGNARCAGGALLLPLASQPGIETLNLRIAGDGQYELELGVRPMNTATVQRLTAAGFTSSGDAYLIRTSGRL